MAITVQGLIDHLQEHVRENRQVADLEVWLSSDGEGNSYRPSAGDFDILLQPDTEDTLEKEVSPGVIVLYPSW